MRRSLTIPRRCLLPYGRLIALVGLLIAGCNQGIGALQTGVGGTSNKPPGESFRILGQPGTQFSAIIFDQLASWRLQGSVPLSVVLANPQPPAGSSLVPIKMIVTKTSPGSGLLSVQLTEGFQVRDVSSTSEPYGTATIQNSIVPFNFQAPPPPANPDIRFFVRGPLAERFSGLIEDTQQGFLISDRAPTVFLVESPAGKVDGVFNQTQFFGPFDIELIVNGALISHQTGAPTVTVHE